MPVDGAFAFKKLLARVSPWRPRSPLDRPVIFAQTDCYLPLYRCVGQFPDDNVTSANGRISGRHGARSSRRGLCPSNDRPSGWSRSRLVVAPGAFASRSGRVLVVGSRAEHFEGVPLTWTGGTVGFPRPCLFVENGPPRAASRGRDPTTSVCDGLFGPGRGVGILDPQVAEHVVLVEADVAAVG